MAPTWDFWTKSAAFGDELLTGFPEFSDPPAVDDRIEHCLEVTEPQGTYADWVKHRAVVEPVAKYCKQADYGMRQPAHREPHKKDENSSECSCLEAHVNFNLWGAL